MKKLLSIMIALALFPTAAAAQDEICYMEWEGQLVDLSSLCTNAPVEITSAPVAAKLGFSNIQISPTSDGNSLEVSGVVINESNQVSSVSAVRFNVIGQDGRILASDTAPVEVGAGLEPGQQLGFSKLINKSILGGNPNTANLRVEISGSV
jgi:hypothetical protein